MSRKSSSIFNSVTNRFKKSVPDLEDITDFAAVLGLFSFVAVPTLYILSLYEEPDISQVSDSLIDSSHYETTVDCAEISRQIESAKCDNNITHDHDADHVLPPEL